MEAEAGGTSKTESELERDIRAKIDAEFYAIFTNTQRETNKRWTFGRPDQAGPTSMLLSSSTTS